MDVLVKVYLNEGQDHWTGFHNTFADEPRLRLAAAFTHRILEADTMRAGWMTKLLDQIFEQLNIGGDAIAATTWTSEYREEGNRSLSVGDVVHLEGVFGIRAHSCESIGWREVEREDLVAAIRKFNLDGEYVR